LFPESVGSGAKHSGYRDALRLTCRHELRVRACARVRTNRRRYAPCLANVPMLCRCRGGLRWPPVAGCKFLCGSGRHRRVRRGPAATAACACLAVRRVRRHGHGRMGLVRGCQVHGLASDCVGKVDSLLGATAATQATRHR
jgi:hypothetical protein